MEGRYCYFFHTYLQFFFVCNIAHNHCDYLLFLIRNKNSTMKIISFLFLSSILNFFDSFCCVIEIVVIVFVIEHFSRQLSRIIFDDIINNLYVKKKSCQPHFLLSVFCVKSIFLYCQYSINLFISESIILFVFHIIVYFLIFMYFIIGCLNFLIDNYRLICRYKIFYINKRIFSPMYFHLF